MMIKNGRVGFGLIALAGWSLSLGALILAPVVALIRGDVQAGVPLALTSLGLNLLGWVGIGLAVAERRRRTRFAPPALPEPGDLLIVEVDGERRYTIAGDALKEWRSWPPS